MSRSVHISFFRKSRLFRRALLKVIKPLDIKLLGMFFGRIFAEKSRICHFRNSS
nr:MAG TPA: hypothetical protein [Caudoviricetes sp.]